jgi:hypothetical protein
VLKIKLIKKRQMLPKPPPKKTRIHLVILCSFYVYFAFIL